MIEFWSNLPPVVQMLIKGLAVIGVIFPLATNSREGNRQKSWLAAAQRGRYAYRDSPEPASSPGIA